MDRTWKDVRNLRRGSLDLARSVYSGWFVDTRGIKDKARSRWGDLLPFELYNRIEKEKITREQWEEKRRKYLENGRFWVPEPAEVRVDADGRCRCRYNPDLDMKASQEIFDTSLGRFVSHDLGEFGGNLILPDGKKMPGNFCEIVECGGVVYGIDSCGHFSVGHINVYAFDASMSPRLLYGRGIMVALFAGCLPDDAKDDEGSFKTIDATLEWLSFDAFCRADDSLFVLLSGQVQREGETEW